MPEHGTHGTGWTTEVSRPVPHHVLRPRLLRALDDAEASCVLVVAAAGSGKTELLRSWAPAQPDGDIVDLAALPAGADLGVGGRRRRYLAVDNLHLADDAQLDAVLAVQRRHRTTRLILLGRWLPDRIRVAMATRPSVVQLRGLAFTPDEITALCAALHGGLPPAVIRQVYAVAGGWAAGTVIAANVAAAHRFDADHHLEQLRRTGAELGDYVMRDVLGHLPLAVCRAVRRTSLAESICGSLFDAITGRRDGGSLLADLARDEMFAAMLGSAGWFRYRQLWRAALYHQLAQEEPDRLAGLHLRAATWYRERRRFHDALRHLAYARDEAGTDQVSELYGPTMTAEGSFSIVLPPPAGAASRRRSPADTDAGTARLVAFATAGRQALFEHRPLELLGLTEDWLPLARRHSPAAHARALMFQAGADFEAGNLDRSADAAAHSRQIFAAEGLVGAHDDGWARIIHAAIALFRHRLAEATDHLDRLVVELPEALPELNTFELLYRAMIVQQHGDVLEAIQIVNDLVESEDPPAEATPLLVDLLLSAGHVTDAERHLRLRGARLSEPERRVAIAKIRLAQDRAEEADAALRPLLARPPQHATDRIEILLTLARAARRGTGPVHDRELLREASDLAERSGIRRPFVVPPPATERGTAQAPAELSPTELAVLAELVGLRTVSEIAEHLYVSVNTVKTHILNIHRKLGTHSRRDTVARARELGLL